MTNAEGQARIAPLTAEEITSLAELPWHGMPTWSHAAWHAYAAAAPENAATRRVVLGSHDAEGALLGWIAGTQVLDSAELEHVLVDPRQRGTGIARELLRAWLWWCCDGDASNAWLEVRAGNVTALGLYRMAGFVEVARRARYYSDPVEDAVVMRWQCIESEASGGAVGAEEA